MLRIFKNNGFSLVEVVIYVALLAVLLIGVTGSLLAVSKTSRELAASQSLQNEGSSVMDRLTREIREAEAVSGGSFDSHPGQLILSTEGLSGGSLESLTIGVDEADNLYLKIGSAATSTLTGRTEVRSFVARQITASSVEAVRLELVLGTRPGLVDKTINLYNTVILRASYVQ